MKVQARARVQITVEVELSQPWDGAETVENVYKRAKEQAVEQLTAVLTGKLLNRPLTRIIGEADVLGILTEEPC